MKVKVLVVLFSIFVISVFALAISACGILDEDSGAKIDCTKLCAKEKECDKEMTDSDVKDCEAGCNKVKDSGYYQDTFVNTVDSCYDKSCSEIDSCIEKGTSSCKAPDYMPYVNTACDKMVSCGAEGTKDECVAGGKEALEKEMNESSSFKCFTDKFFSDLADCIKKANCETLDDDVDKCLQNMVDIK